MGVALPGAATLGFYALTGCTFLGMLIFHASRHRSLAGIVSRHALLLLMASLFCFDYMFNNFGGTTSLKDGSYGLVACLDLIIFVFVWALGLKYLPGTGSDYTESFMALLVPVFPVLREMVRAEKPIHIGPATVDLVVVIFLMASWITLPYGSSEPAQYGRVAKLCKYVVCAALLYNLIGCLKTSHLSCWD
jgi:lysylphosphatidylglycerol synthetase-like protein (DUF2156 family)